VLDTAQRRSDADFRPAEHQAGAVDANVYQTVARSVAMAALRQSRGRGNPMKALLARVDIVALWGAATARPHRPVPDEAITGRSACRRRWSALQRRPRARSLGSAHNEPGARLPPDACRHGDHPTWSMRHLGVVGNLRKVAEA
jgi:hypothetical protein